MAKVTDQSIPSEDRIKYKRQCQISTTSRDIQFVRGRYPWRVPISQEGGRAVSAAQNSQRDKFKLVKNKYATLSASDKVRWKDANPEWHSYLFGYNFFMLEGLLGGGLPTYPQMIKSIQVVKEEVPTSGTKSFTITTVDPAKCVVLIQGNSYISDKIQRGSNTVNQNSTVNCALSPSVQVAISEVILQGEVGDMEIIEGTGYGRWAAPYVSALIASQLTVGLQAIASGVSCTFSYEVIEHLAQTIYPVLVSIAAEAVVIDWAKVPSVAADVSITVVEYI